MFSRRKMLFAIYLPVFYYCFQSYYRVGSALSELKEYDRALDVYRKGLNLEDTTENDKYEIVEKIMKIAYNCEGTT